MYISFRLFTALVLILAVVIVIIVVIVLVRRKNNGSSTTPTSGNTTPIPSSITLAAKASQDIPLISSILKDNTKTRTIIFCGDSTTFGSGSNTGPYPKDKSFAFQLADKLGASTDGFIGWANIGPAYGDSRLVLSGNVVAYRQAQNDSFLMGGVAFQLLDNTSKLIFTPSQTGTVDVTIYYAIGNGYGDLNVNGLVINANNPSSDIGSKTLTLTTPIIVTKSSAAPNPAFLLGLNITRSKALNIYQYGCPGSRVIDWSSGTSFFGGNVNTLNQIRNTPSDLYVFMLGVNDWIQNTDLITFKAKYTNLIGAVQNAEVLLMTPIPSKITTVSAEMQAKYVAAIKEVAVKLNVPVLDLYTQLGAYETHPNFYADDLHPNADGYAFISNILEIYLNQ